MTGGPGGASLSALVAAFPIVALPILPRAAPLTGPRHLSAETGSIGPLGPLSMLSSRLFSSMAEPIEGMAEGSIDTDLGANFPVIQMKKWYNESGLGSEDSYYGGCPMGFRLGPD